MSARAEELAGEILAGAAGFLAETGADLRDAGGQLKALTAQHVANLATLVGQPGYEMAVEAAQDIIAMEIAKVAYGKAKRLDDRIVGTVLGGLNVAARLLGAAS